MQQALEISQRAHLLSEGRIAMHGSPAEMRGSDEVQRSVLGLDA